uniref:Uncharacterized protein n=1 Tax=Romanomermis culicivorax TaxID=13658 RepID=A0A915IUZ9_ROMCU
MPSKVNPCFCWHLKDGCVTIGLWSLIWSIVQLGVFSWQTASVKAVRDRMDSRRIPLYQSYSVHYNRLGGGGWNQNDVTPEEKMYMGKEMGSR